MNAFSRWTTPSVIQQSECMARSLRQWTGRDLLPGNLAGEALARALYEAPFVLVSHGTEPDPVLNYGNGTALGLWQLDWDAFTHLPSRYTAEAPNREERARLLEAVTRQGYIDDYSGVRISSTGRRFRIARATVWNLVAPDGSRAGQAAMFDRWQFFEGT